MVDERRASWTPAGATLVPPPAAVTVGPSRWIEADAPARRDGAVLAVPPVLSEEEALLASRILVIDHRPECLRQFERLLGGEGFHQVIGTTEPERTLDLVAAFDPDLVVLELTMPALSGYAVLDQLRQRRLPQDYRPVLVVTSDATLTARRRALSLGARDLLLKPYDAVEAMLRVWNLLETRAITERLRRAAAAVG